DGGGWLWFQGVLRALRAVADRHGVDLATVALRWVLDREGVTAAIVGIRPGGRLEDLAAAMQIRLSDDDEHLIRSATGPSPGPEGDVYAAERVRGGRHAAIMRYDLNRDPV
ncbi:MAG: aldo/keto reductase, partial [Gemmatimonadales bacterium]|nr:aldo/keto reductase [Gemmatimonadales bacterium]